MILQLVKSDSIWTWGHNSLKKESSGPLEYMTLVYGGHSGGECVSLCSWGICSHQRVNWSVLCLTAVLFACCVNVQTKRIIMAESRYDKYEEHWGSFIILTASIVFWPAGTGQSIPVYWNRLKTCLPWLWIRILICFLSHQEVLKELVAVDIEVYYVQRLGWCVHGEIFWNCFDFLHIIYSPVRAIKQLYSSGFHLFF